jgi:FkbM family methyltransferase
MKNKNKNMFGITNNLENHSIYSKNEWTSGYYKEVINYLKKNEIKSFIDIGACSGVLNEILFSEIESLEKCIMVEAINNNYRFIINKYKKDNIKVYNKAIFYGKEELELGIVNGNVGAYSYQSSLYSETVKTITIEEIINDSVDFIGSNKVDFIKIDVEGSEYNILENSIILKEVNYIEIEFHNNKEYGILEGQNRFNFWNDFTKKYLPNHELVLGGGYRKYKWPNGQEVIYDGSGFFEKKN